MSRNKVLPEKQKQTVSVRIPNELMVHIEGIKNKSKFFEWLLEEHFNNIKQNQ